MNILICDPSSAYAKKLIEQFTDPLFIFTTVSNGRDCQLKLSHHKFDFLIMDADTSSHSALEVINYCRLHHLKTRIYMTFETSLKMYEFSSKGISGSFSKEDHIHDLVDRILTSEGLSVPERDFVDLGEIEAEFFEMCVISNSTLLINTESLLNIFVFKEGMTYERILRKGQLIKQIPSSTLFIRVKDRIHFVQAMNLALTKVSPEETVQVTTKFRGMKETVDHYISEFHTKGLNPGMIEEGKKVCASMYSLISKDRRLKDLLRDYEEKSPSSYSKNFLISFFSSLIAKSLPWGSQRTVEMVALGGLLQDIGLPPEEFYLLQKEREDMSIGERVRFELHPALGFQMLQSCRDIPEGVGQIVYQHHEYVNGEGFPNRLSGKKIYPLAKIVSVATGFTEDMLRSGLSPVQSLSAFATEKKNFARYEHEFMKALIKCFIKEKS